MTMAFLKKFYTSCREAGLIATTFRAHRKLRNLLALRFPGWVTPGLVSVSIEPTNKCNLKCTMCYSQQPKIFKEREKGVMDWNFYKKVVDEISTMPSVRYLGLNFGGESCLHEKFVDMLNYAASKKKFTIGFHTNGMLLSKKICNALVGLGIDRVTISLGGLRQSTERIRCGADYSVIERNIRYLCGLRGDLNKPHIAVNMAVIDQDEKEIREFIDYWTKIVDTVEIDPVLTETVRIQKPREFFDSEVKADRLCSQMFTNLAILWNGDITICCSDINGVNVVGNLKNSTIRQVWGGNEMRKLRIASLKKSFPEKSLCYGCNVWKVNFCPKIKKVDENLFVMYNGISKTYQQNKQ